MEWLVNTIMQINTRRVSRPIPTVHSRGPKGNQATDLKESNNLCFICFYSFQLLSTGVFWGEYSGPFFLSPMMQGSRKSKREKE